MYMTLAFLALLGAPYIYDISSLRVNTTCVSHYVRNVEQFLRGLKELCHEADCLFQYSAEFKNVWS